MKKKILIITTGGTLACVSSENGLLPGLNSKDILSYISDITSLYDVDFYELFQLDSANIQPENWQAMGLIYNGKVINGFKAGNIDSNIQKRINQLIGYANDGGDNMDKYRILLSDAIDIAKKENIIISEDVIGWRTDGHGLGGGSVEVFIPS